MRWLELRIPPLAVVGVSAALMWILARQFPPFSYSFPGQAFVAIIAATIGLCIDVIGVLQFRNARTTTNPMNPKASSSIVRNGLYRYTRNPMYVGFVLVLLGFALYLGNVLALLVLPAFAFYLTRFQIKPEEAILSGAFGSEYAQYQREVRRWI